MLLTSSLECHSDLVALSMSCFTFCREKWGAAYILDVQQCCPPANGRTLDRELVSSSVLSESV